MGVQRLLREVHCYSHPLSLIVEWKVQTYFLNSKNKGESFAAERPPKAKSAGENDKAGSYLKGHGKPFQEENN